jgi:hypothetical protein
MTAPNDAPAAKPARLDTDNWAHPVDRLDATAVSAGARHDGVTGRRTAGPLQGFGQMWQMILEVPLAGSSATPQEVIAVWKERFTAFWPDDATFYAPLAGILPGEVALLEVKPGPGPIRMSTGVVCIFADDESFAFMTPEGHALAAWITFSASVRDGVTYARVEALERPADPLIELSYMLGAKRLQDRFWERTLANVAAHFGAPDAVVERRVICVDRRRQWRYLGNVRRNAVLRSFADAVLHPRTWLRRG